MTYHGRLTPGVVRDADTPIRLVLHSPPSAAGLVIKIWELDTYVSARGRTVREGTADDLLAEIEGDLQPGPGKRPAAPDWRTFTPTRVSIVGEDPSLISFRLTLPGAAEPLIIPIVSEAGETEGRTYELGFSLHLGGAEVFRTRSPCLFTPALVYPRIERELRVGEVVVDRDALRLHRACLGVARGEGLEARLDILACGRVDLQGQLVDDRTGQPLGLRPGRRLHAYFHTEAQELPLGPSEIPIALCDPLADDGTIVHRRAPALDPWGARPLELARGRGSDGGLSFAPLGEAPAGPGRLGEGPHGLGGLAGALRQGARR